MASDRLTIQVNISSTREKRFGATDGEWFTGEAGANDDIDVELIDLRDYPLPFFDEPVSPAGGHLADEAIPWAEKISRGDGYVIVAAEYNHGRTAVRAVQGLSSSCG